MTDTERAEAIGIMESLKELPETQKQFLLGYAAGMVAHSADEKTEKGNET